MANGDAGWRWGASRDGQEPAYGGQGNAGQCWSAGDLGWTGPHGTRPLRLPGPGERGYPSAGPGPGAEASAGPPDSGYRRGNRVPRRMVLAVLGAAMIGTVGAMASAASPQPPATGGRQRPEAGESPRAGGPASPGARTQGRGTPARPVYYIDGGPKTVALTIDDGPGPAYTPQILRVLEKYHVTALFSMVGENVASYPQIAREVTDAGHAIANHTWSHPDMAVLHRATMRKEVTRATDEIHAATGQRPAMFRAPYGAWSRTLLDYLAAQGLTPLAWSVDPRDWARPGVTAIVADILRTTRTGSIILEHDGGGDRSQTVAALKIVLPRLLDAGYQFGLPQPAATAALIQP